MIERVTEEENMLTVFLPMGPNPFMGGFILHMSEEEVYRLDLSVEEGISSIVSFGVAVEIDDHPPDVPVNLDKIQRRLISRCEIGYSKTLVASHTQPVGRLSLCVCTNPMSGAISSKRGP